MVSVPLWLVSSIMKNWVGRAAHETPQTEDNSFPDHVSTPSSALGTAGQPHHHPNPVPLPAKGKSGSLWDKSKRQCGSQAAGRAVPGEAPAAPAARSVLSTAVQREPVALSLGRSQSYD